MSHQAEEYDVGSIAIIGLGARFPGAENIQAYWENLSAGKECVTRFSEQDLQKAGVDKALYSDPNYVKAAAVLEDIEYFDAEFFGFKPLEADITDPQQRLFLECAWEALENAGYAPSGSEAAIGVYAGSSISTYLLYNLASRLDHTGADFNLTTLVGNDKDYLAPLVAYKFNLTGPAITMQTACSTSLVATHQACQGLLNYECDMALAGGVTVRVPHRVGYMDQGGSMLASDGHCRTFDKDAGGTLPGSGAGVVVLKRLQEAIADRDHVYAVIRGSAVNNDGSSRIGFTAPSAKSQARVIATAHAVAGVESESISYVEAHGTGTALGDPIEIEALTQAFANGTETSNRQAYCAIGSVKTSFGHLECAAGVAGLIKTVLALKNKQIPASLNYRQANPNINFDKSPFFVNTSLKPWRSAHAPRRAAVSSFGFGGTNCHMVLEEAPDTSHEVLPHERGCHLLTLSARSENALKALIDRYHSFMQVTQAPLGDICFSANSGRALFAHRCAILADDVGQAAQLLASYSSGMPGVGVFAGQLAPAQTPKIGFLFSGESAAYLNMGRELYATEPLFRQTLQQCDQLLQVYLGQSVIAALYPEQAAADAALASDLSQPAIFALAYSLASLWRSWGVEPTYVLGYGVGEYVAACVAEVYTLEEGVKIIANRAKIMPPLEGSDRALEQPVLDALEKAVAEVNHKPPKLQFISTLTAQPVEPEHINAQYWRRYEEQTMHFAAGLEEAVRLGCNLFVEIGPKFDLCTLGQEAIDNPMVKWLPSLNPEKPDWQQMLSSLAQLYCAGVAVNWANFDQHYPRYKTPLPTYPFQRQRHWIDRPAHAVASKDASLHPFLAHRLASNDDGQILFEARLMATAPAYLDHHRAGDAVVFPLTAYIETAFAAASTIFEGDTLSLQALAVEQPLFLSGTRQHCYRTQLSTKAQGGASFEISTSKDSDAQVSRHWARHLVGKICVGGAKQPQAVSLQAIQLQCNSEQSVQDFYQNLAAHGMHYGESFQGVKSLWQGEGQSLGRVELAENLAADEAYIMHPALLDACLQVAGAMLLDATTTESKKPSHMPVSVASIECYGLGSQAVWSHAIRQQGAQATGTDVVFDLCLFDQAGIVVAEIKGLKFRQVQQMEAKLDISPDWLYRVQWQPIELDSAAQRSLEPGLWLVFSDGQGLGKALAERLASSGQQCITVYAGEQFQQASADCYHVNPQQAADFAQVFSHIQGQTGSMIRGVVYLWGAELTRQTNAASLLDGQKPGYAGLMHLAQGLHGNTLPDKFGLWVVTRGAQTDNAQSVNRQDLAPIQALSWGLGRVIQSEHPEFNAVLIDLDGCSDQAAAKILQNEISLSDAEGELIYRKGRRLASRLQRWTGKLAPLDQPYSVDAHNKGVLDNLEIMPTRLRQPGKGEVGVRVYASSLNFRDVLNVLDMYPGDAGPLGGDCAGEIYAIGEGVSGLDIGRAVVVATPGSLSSHVVAPAEFVVDKPANLSFEQASALPTVMLTAHYALNYLGKLDRGEKVLIHAAAGGVGLAAVQLALEAGATLFVTAGSQEKRQYLRDLGIRHVMDSRSLAFAETIKAETNGEGIDMVLNSLSGEFIPRSLSLLKPGGRFFEIGKNGIWQKDEVAASYPDVAYYPIALDELMQSEPGHIGNLLSQVMEPFATGAWQAVNFITFPLAEVVDAFRYMQQAKHIGKIVVSHPAAMGQAQIKPEASYLITGGLGALGLEVAAHLADRGAKCLVLFGRKAPTEPVQKRLQSLEEKGVQVICRQGDVSRQDDVDRLLAHIRQALPPLRGVVHAAGVVDDGMLANLDMQRSGQVLSPKVAGAWHLHQGTAGDALDFFLLYSSVSSLLGLPGQAAYAAANSFLDTLSHYRQSQGKPSLTVNWGALSLGMSSRMPASERQRLTSMGMGQMSAGQALLMQDSLLAANQPQLAVLDIDWARFLPQSGMGGNSLLADLADKLPQSSDQTEQDATNPLRQELGRLPESERLGFVQGQVRQQAMQTLGLSAAQLADMDVSLLELGMDSLQTVEFRNLLAGLVGSRLPATLVFEHPTIAGLSRYLCQEVLHCLPATSSNEVTSDLHKIGDKGEPTSKQDAPETRDQIEADVADLSEDELKDFIASELEKIGG